MSTSCWALGRGGAAARARKGNEGFMFVRRDLQEGSEQQRDLPGRAALAGLDLLQGTLRAGQRRRQIILADSCFVPSLLEPLTERSQNQGAHRCVTPPIGEHGLGICPPQRLR